MYQMNVLITGGAGFVGSHLSRALLAQGHDVTIYDDLSMGKIENVPTGAYFIRDNVRDYGALRIALTNIDAVIHLAARVSIRDSSDNFHEDAQTNLFGTINLMKALKGTKVKHVIFSSSMAVYSDNSLPLSEGAPKEPISAYGISKLSAEKYILLIARELGIKATVLRYFNIFGPGQSSGSYVGVVRMFTNRLLDGESPVIYGNGCQVRDFVSVHDVVDATVAAMGHDSHTGTFNIGSGTATSVNEIASMLIGKINPDLRPEYAAALPGELQYSVADIRLAKSLLGFQPKRFIQNSLDDIIEAIKASR